MKLVTFAPARPGAIPDSWAAAARWHGIAAEARADISHVLPGIAPRLDWADGAVVLLDDVEFSVEWATAVRMRARAVLLYSNRRLPTEESLRAVDGFLTPFPHAARTLADAGCRVLEWPVAFDPRAAGVAVDGTGARPEEPIIAWQNRDNRAIFVGQWEPEAHAVSACAESIPGFLCYSGPTPHKPPTAVRRAHGGQPKAHERAAFFGYARVVLDRHGAESTAPRGDGAGRKWYTTNQTTVDAPGLGALLLTEQSVNLARYLEPWRECLPYGDPREAVTHARWALNHPDEAAGIAAAGQARVWNEHLVIHRIPRLMEFAASVAR